MSPSREISPGEDSISSSDSNYCGCVAVFEADGSRYGAAKLTRNSRCVGYLLIRRNWVCTRNKRSRSARCILMADVEQHHDSTECEVRASVLVEIATSDARCASSNTKSNRALESTIAIAQKQKIAGPRREIQLAIAVEVGQNHLTWSPISV